MSQVSMWKIIGLRGWSICEMHIRAVNAEDARRFAISDMGFWLVLRTLPY